MALLITLALSYSVRAEQSSQTLYSYVMNKYSKEFSEDSTYRDTTENLIKLKELQEQYKIDSYNKLKIDSYNAAKKFATELQNDFNESIEKEIKELTSNQKEVNSKIESNLLELSPKNLSKLNRENNKYQEEINNLLEDKTSIVSLFKNIKYDKIDLEGIKDEIEEQKEIIGDSSTYDTSHYLGELDQLKRPFDGSVVVTSNAGFRTDPVYGGTRFHNGTDYAINVGTELRAVFNGTVVRSDNTGDGYGENIKIDCGDGIILHYAHLSKRYVEVGDKVSQNDIIGLSGNTGKSTGPHLHLSLYINSEVLSIEELFK